jgi:RNA polymerase sigma factor (sigma-70 family)
MAPTAALFLRHLRRLGVPPGPDPTPDALLLDRFIRQRDEAAFTALVARHGPMVLRVCQRIVGDRHAAEDAFQATFLILARRARTIRRPAALASWLHGVARHAALKAGDAGRRRLETPAADLAPPDPHPDVLDVLSAREALRILDEEVRGLPEAYRLPVILCYLEGCTQEEAARQLGWTPGSVKGRLERGRQRLHQRLVRRGLTLAATVALVEFAHATSADPAVALAALTVRAASAFAVGGAVGVSGITADVMALAEEGVKGLVAVRTKVALGFVLTLGVVAAGAGLLASHVHVPGQDSSSGAAPAGRGQERPAPADRFGDPLPPGALARLGTTRFRLGGAVAFLPDGQALVSGGFGNTNVARLWDAATGKELRRFGEPAHGWIYSIALAPGGKVLATGTSGMDGDHRIRLWEVATGKELLQLRGFRTLGKPLAFSPDARTLAVADMGDVHLYDTADGKELRQFGGSEHREQIAALAFSPDGKTLATGSYDRAVRLWNASTGKCLHTVEGHGEKVEALAFSPDGKLLASGGWDRMVHLIDPLTGKVRLRLEQAGPVRDVAFSPDGRDLGVGVSDGVARLYEAATGKELRQFRGHQGPVRSLSFAPDGKTLATESEDFTIRLWETATGKELTHTAGHAGQVEAVAFSPDGKTLASGANYDECARLWNATTGKELRQFPGHGGGVRSLALSPDGQALATGDGDGHVRLWETATGKERYRLPGRGRVDCLALSPDGRILAWADWDRKLRLCDAATGQELRRIALVDYQYGLAFSPDGKTLAGAVWDRSVRLWEVSSGAELRRFEGLPRGGRALAFAPDGRAVAVAFSGDTGADEEGKGPRKARRRSAPAVQLLDVADGRELRRFEAHGEVNLTTVAFSRDGKTLAAGTDTGTVLLWEVLTGAERRRFVGHDGWVGGVAFAPDGRVLASGGHDTTLLLWDVTGRRGALAEPVRLNAEELDRAWVGLASEDGSRAHAALWVLVGAGQQAVALLGERLRPVTADARVARLIAQLDSDDFGARERASAELAACGQTAEAALRAALKGDASAEVRQRLARLLQRLKEGSLPADVVRGLRGVEVLEQVGTHEARRLLEGLAKGTPEAALTREARASLGRLAKPRGLLAPAEPSTRPGPSGFSSWIR